MCVGLPVPPRLPGDTTIEHERVVIHTLRLAALGLNESFGAACAEEARTHGGRFFPAPIKGFSRIFNKSVSVGEHRNEPPPRPMLNLDVVRCLLVMNGTEALKRCASGLCARFGGAVARLKNAYANSEEEAKDSFYYRALLAGVVFPLLALTLPILGPRHVQRTTTDLRLSTPKTIRLPLDLWPNHNAARKTNNTGESCL